MISKSALYCHPAAFEGTGLLLLSEVALGQLQELDSEKFITKLDEGCSAVIARGRLTPDPKTHITLPDGVRVPIGKPKTPFTNQSLFRFNEYIVYDEAQVRMRYLLKVKFKNFFG